MRVFEWGILVACGTVVSGLLITMPSALAEEKQVIHDAKTCYAYGSDGLGNKYCTKRIKSRAKRGYTNNGTAIYSHTEITEWNDDLVEIELENGDVDLLGNVDANNGVREVHNVVEVKTDVDSQLNDLKIGTVDLKSHARRINNSVTIDGDLKSNGKGSLEIGTVTINSGSAQSVQSSVRAGKIDAKRQRVTIGGIKVRKARNVQKVQSKVTIKGGVRAK